jgi:putative Mn2+ efflux pump MntP
MLQSIVDNEYRGRVFSFEFAMLTLAQSISSMWAGIGLDQLQMSVQEVLRWTSLIGFVAFLVWAWFQLWMRTQTIQTTTQPRLVE